MLFADILFLFVFLPLCLISYFVCKDIKAKNAVLLVFSLIFYAWGEPVRILLLVLSAAINYAFAIMIELSKGTRKAKSYLVMSLIYNIGMLAIFKYTDFFLQNVNALLGTSIPMQNIALPLGISFYTFQIISYVIDVYWDKALRESFQISSCISRCSRSSSRVLSYVTKPLRVRSGRVKQQLPIFPKGLAALSSV